MKIDLRKALGGPKRFEFTLGPEWWARGDENDPVFSMDSPLRVRMDVHKAGDRFVLNGSLRGRLSMRCDRCLGLFPVDLETDFQLYLSADQVEGEESERELADDDMEVRFVSDWEMEASEVIREQIYLSLPMKALCDEDCRGICPVCGANLNERMCECRSQEGHPAFQKLKTLKL